MTKQKFTAFWWLGERFDRQREMDALLELVKSGALPLPKTFRGNVSPVPVCSITVGAVNQRASAGLGIAAATLLDQGFLLRLLHDVAKDGSLYGERVQFYDAICLNVNFACKLHRDASNGGPSAVVAAGEYSGGELFVEDQAGDTIFQEDSGREAIGFDHDVHRRFHVFDASRRRHGVRSFEGFRISVVFFAYPESRLSARIKHRLSALGFPQQNRSWSFGPSSPCLSTMPPYCIFICTRHRHLTLMKHTIRELLADGSIAPATITLCVSDEEEAIAYGNYETLGLRILVAREEAAGPNCTRALPEQRRSCLAHRSYGSWNLFVDDDISRIHLHSKAQWMTLHELIMIGFLRAENKRTRLWGLNTSGDIRNLRNQVSDSLGLINGYFFGQIHEANNPALSLSNKFMGAAEDIERSVRHFHHRGILRLNFACAIAHTWRNPGGMQDTFVSSQARKEAHDCVLSALIEEFPGSLHCAANKPNRCRFRTQASPSLAGTGDRENSPRTQVARSSLVATEKGSLNDAKPERPKHSNPLRAREAKGNMKPHSCPECSKSYVRKIDLTHHMRTQHSGAQPSRKYQCLTCNRLFLKEKDLDGHRALGRCFSKRGRYAKMAFFGAEHHAPYQSQEDPVGLELFTSTGE